jgi:hypothetical protein
MISCSPYCTQFRVEWCGCWYRMVDNFRGANFVESQRKPSELMFVVLNFPAQSRGASDDVIDTPSRYRLISFVTKPLLQGNLDK